MAGCSIDEAFPDIAGETRRGEASSYQTKSSSLFKQEDLESGRVARKEERRKAKRCGGPALAFLKAGGEGNHLGNEVDVDPDRQNLIPLPPAEKLGKEEGFTSDQQPSNSQWLPQKTDPNEAGAIKNLIGQRVDDVIGEKSRNTLPKAIESTTQLPDPNKNFLGETTASYFGKSLDSNEGFADFSSSLTDNPGYTLTSGQKADFLGSFAATNFNKAAGVPTLSTPSVNDAWKPLTPSGTRSSFFESLPIVSNGSTSDVFNRDEKEALVKKIDTLFARLEDLETKRNENAHIEVSMFVLSGLFLIYGIDALRRI